MSDLYLIRLGAPSRGDAIHLNTCRVISRAKGDPLRWTWADEHPDVDWTLRAPWLRACKVCKPPAIARDLGWRLP